MAVPERLFSLGTSHAHPPLSGVELDVVATTGTVDVSVETDVGALVVVSCVEGLDEVALELLVLAEVLDVLAEVPLVALVLGLVPLVALVLVTLVLLVVGAAVTGLESSDEVALGLVLGSAALSLVSPLVSAVFSPGPVNCHQLNLNPPPVKRRNKSCLPSALLTLHDWVAQVWTPPVAATVQVPIVLPSRESRWNSTAPALAAATRRSTAVAPVPNSTSSSLM